MGNCLESPCDGCTSEFTGFETCHGVYKFGQVLGTGSQAKVQACTDMRSGRELAVKVFDRSRKRAMTNYRREIDICKACGDASNLMQIVDHFLERRNCFVVMERYAGSLHAGLKWFATCWGGYASLSNVVLRHIIQQAFAGILHMHRCNIVHRDIKAQNFLVDRLDVREESCRVVLGDFGLARPLLHGEVLVKPAGTRKYWAPELYDRKYWHAVDIFALGVLVIYASTGEFPYADEHQLRKRDIFEDDVVPKRLDAEAVEVLRATLEKDPDKRIKGEELSAMPWLQQQRGPKPARIMSPLPKSGDSIEVEEELDEQCSRTQESVSDAEDSTDCSASSDGSGLHR